MITTLRITNIEEAKTAQKMISAYLSAYGEEETVETPAPKTVSKPKTAPKAEKVSEPVKETKTVKKAPAAKKAPEKKEVETEGVTLATVTAKAKEVRGATDTATVKAIIAEFTTGKISTIKEEDYEAFMTALEAVGA